MPTFTTPAPLHQRITTALAALRQARLDGEPQQIYVAQRRLDVLIDQWPRSHREEN